MSLYYGYSIRLSKSDHFSPYNPGKENYLGQFNLVDMSEEVFKPNDIERRIQRNIILPFMNLADNPRMLFNPSQATSTYFHQFHLDSTGFFDVLFNWYTDALGKFHLTDFIDFKILNDLMGKTPSRRGLWAKFLEHIFEHTGDIPDSAFIEIDTIEGLKLFLKAVLIDAATGAPFEYIYDPALPDSNPYYDIGSYQIHPKFQECLYYSRFL